MPHAENYMSRLYLNVGWKVDKREGKLQARRERKLSTKNTTFSKPVLQKRWQEIFSDKQKLRVSSSTRTTL